MKMESRSANMSERSLVAMQYIMAAAGGSGQHDFVTKTVDGLGGDDFLVVKQVWDEATHRIAVDRLVMAESLGCSPDELRLFVRKHFDRLRHKPAPSYTVQTLQA